MAANTYTLISSNVLASSAATVTFSSIPATYTDLVLRGSVRGDLAGVFTNLFIKFNSDTATNYSDTYLTTSNGTTAMSARDTSQAIGYVGLTDAATATTSTFGNFEIYVPSYGVSQNKPYLSMATLESNTASLGYANLALAGLWRNTAAMTSIIISPDSGSNFVSGSSFYLYGIKNS